MEFSIEILKPLAEQFAQLCSQALQAEPEQTIRQLETDMRKNLQLLGRLTLGQVLSQVEQVPEKRLQCSCGGELQDQRRRTAKVESVFGWVSYARAYYAGCGCQVGCPLGAGRSGDGAALEQAQRAAWPTISR